jgi:predicted CXXCH cytochrome family protein
MRPNFIPCSIFLLLLVLMTAGQSQGAISLNYPPNRSVFEFNLLSISLEIAQGSTDLIEVRVNDLKELSILPRRDFVCFSVPLEPGINKIKIMAKDGGRTVDEVSLEVFRRSDLVSKYSVPPPGFQKNYFHVEDQPRCAECHIMEPSEKDKRLVKIKDFNAEISKSNDVKPSDSTCYDCHRTMTAYPFVHAPVLVWSCLSCHNPRTVPKYGVQKPDTMLCFSCHQKQKDVWMSHKNLHAPVVTGKCAICHNPHASDAPFILIKPKWLLCLSCHVDKGNGKHIIAKYMAGDTHPTHGVKDPRTGGKELTCTSCHDAHASDSPFFITLKAETGMTLCKECHIDPSKFRPSTRF